MSQPYVGEIRMFGGNFAPAGWMFCEGQLLAIAENETLFQLIGTSYGGDGQTSFALPDLRGRIPLHQGNSFALAQSGGVEQVTLNVNQTPGHSHALLGTTNVATSTSPGGNVSAQTGTFDKYQTTPGSSAMAVQSITATGGSQPHNNIQPYLCVNFIISMFGIFPTQA